MCGIKQPRTNADVWMEAMMNLIRSREGNATVYVDHLALKADEVVAAYEKRFPTTILVEKQ